MYAWGHGYKHFHCWKSISYPFATLLDVFFKGKALKSSNYERNLFQLIVWAPTRERAIARMKRALDDTIIVGKICYNS